MDPQEVTDRLKNVITNIIKDDPEAARAELHDVLAAKMRDRVNPPSETEASTEDSSEDDDEVLDDDTSTDEE